MNSCCEFTVWTSITDDNVAACDSGFFNKFGGVSAYGHKINDKYPDAELTFSCLPEPYSGNPNSNVYCLNMNPGAPDKCFSEDKEFEQATLKNLALEQETCFWADGIYNKCGKLHDGVKWLKQRTRKLEEMLNRQPQIFFIEYFPYHSAKGFDFPADLPSYDFSDMLIRQAIDKKKLIIIMREKAGWLRRIKELGKYENLCYLRCPQGGYLTKENIFRVNNGEKLTDDELNHYF